MIGIDEMMRYPFPSDMTHSSSTNKIAWAFNEQGKRNVYVAEGPKFEAQKLTYYMDDDGQEISSLSLSADGEWVVFSRGGEHGSNWDTEVPFNPLSKPFSNKVQVWSVRFSGGEPLLLGEGANPIISPNSDAVLFEKNKQLWKIPVDASQEAAELFSLRGRNASASWSPDGSKIAFVSNRGDHAYIGIYTNPEARIRWINPGFDKDDTPRWSPDGTRIVFMRRPGSGGSPRKILKDHHSAWSLVTHNLVSGETKTIWKAPETLPGSFPGSGGGTNLHWAARSRIIFLSYQDGWPHLYSLPETAGDPILLTPGNFMTEHISLSSDK
ncbi:MAG: S9 family peptidase, partial [Candidatus Latescibacteria bacterium]|nr:S9 family peptidase [Candidatus Latescibacterota bacterium]